MRKLHGKIPLIVAFVGCWVAIGPAVAEKPPTRAMTPADVRAELPQRLRELDSPSYDARCRAAACLEHWIGVPELADVLAEEFQRRVLEPDLPMEVRWRIDLWRGRLPRIHLEPPREVSSQELQRLVSLLDDDSYSARVGACRRLQWLAGSEQLSAPILLLLKHRLTDPALSQEMYFRIEEVRKVAWGVWLNSGNSNCFLPPVTSLQIEKWLDDLTQPGGLRDYQSSLRCRVARQGLMDSMSQDAEVPRVTTAIEARLRSKLDQDAKALLKSVLDMTRPAVAIEMWRDHVQVREDHFIVGEKQTVTGGEHPTQFDRADDRTAHCSNGNALSVGDYPVGVAFAAPRWPAGEKEAVYDLVNLPTPRRQIAYSYYVKTDPSARLAAMSRRTLDRFLAEKKLLSDPELGMLGQLDAREVSRFAGRYFLLVEDGAVEEEIDSDDSFSTARKGLGSESSRFGSICAQLGVDGTRDALPGLVDAIRQKRFQQPSPLAPYRLEWLAAFSIAQRDPWPGVDAWLAENLENRQRLDIGHGDAAEIGATAAGVLLTRHHERPAEFGLQLVVDPHILDLKVSGYCYAAAGNIQRVRTWWKNCEQGTQKAAAR